MRPFGRSPKINPCGSDPTQSGQYHTNVELRLASGPTLLSLYNISSISGLLLNQNHLEGSLPRDLGFTLPNLREFLVWLNKFSGLFPPSIANSSNLINFDIEGNYISGPLPANLGTSLPHLGSLNLGDNLLRLNQLPSDLSFLLNSLVNCTRLHSLCLNGNGFRGRFPISIVNLSRTLQDLYLFANNIHGSIPQDIGKLLYMRQLALSDNMLTGSIPVSIGQLSNLGKLFLSGNNISGEIPSSIGNITGLLILCLSGNNLQGNIPTALFTMSKLEGLDLQRNCLRGVIPEQIVGLSSLSLGLLLNQNLLTGPLPSMIGILKQVIELDFSDNKLTGVMPASGGDCLMLESLNMSGNLFEGRIPSSFKKLKSLALLDLSNNNISGDIPRFLEGFRLMQFLSLSQNRLGGEVPKEGVFSNIYTFSVVGNLQLCGGIQALQLPLCPINISRNEKNNFSLGKILLVALLPIFVLACLIFLFYQIKKSKHKNVPISVLQQDEQVPRLSYQDLLPATNEFSPNNLLGKGRFGSVNRGFLESLQHNIVVKVFDVEVRGATKSFMAECETLRSIRHCNLIKIITVCSSTDFEGNDFKASVFEFMINGILENWLHPSLSDQGNERNSRD